MLGKRKTFQDFRQELMIKYQPPGISVSNPNMNDQLGGLRKVGFQTKNLCIPSAEKKGNMLEMMDHELKSTHSHGSTMYPYKTLDTEQLKSYDHFMGEMDSMVKEITSKNYKDPKRDEDLIQLLSLKQFIHRYFGPKDSTFEHDLISRILRTRVSIHDMILVLSSIKYKDKGIDMTLVTVKQFNDILLEILVHPSSFKTNQINFFQSGKNIVNVYIFMLKSFFQQMKVIKSIYCEDFPGVDTQHSFQHPVSVEILTSIITSVLELMAFESSNISVPVVAQNFNSAFQLHSQKHSQEYGQAGHHIGHIQMAGGLVSSMQNISNHGVTATGMLDIPAPNPVGGLHMGSQEQFDVLNSSGNYYERLLRAENRRKPDMYSFEVNHRGSLMLKLDFFKSEEEGPIVAERNPPKDGPGLQLAKQPQPVNNNSAISEMLRRPAPKPTDLLNPLYNNQGRK